MTNHKEFTHEELIILDALAEKALKPHELFRLTAKQNLSKRETRNAVWALIDRGFVDWFRNRRIGLVIDNDFKMIYCDHCGKPENEDNGSWNRDPYMFFCSVECHGEFLTPC